MTGLVRLATGGRIATLLMGSLRRLQVEPITALMADKVLQVTQHHHCAYGVTLADTSMPIFGSICIASNLNLTGRHCKCGDIEHYDIRAYHTGTSKEDRYTDIRRQLYQQLLPEVVQQAASMVAGRGRAPGTQPGNYIIKEPDSNFDLNTSTTTQNYPTESRERAKIREKADKALGIKP